MVTMRDSTRTLMRPSDALGRFAAGDGEPGGSGAHAVSQRYGFHVGGIDLMIRPDTVAELVEQAEIFPIPNAPLWLRGLINQRGNLVPVYDLRTLLEVADDKEGPARRVLILDRGDNMVGLLIDGLPESIRGIEKPTNIPPLPTVLRQYVSKAFADNRTIWLEFDHRGFFQEVAAGKANSGEASGQ